jgi:preprotein translocase subunit SecF
MEYKRFLKFNLFGLKKEVFSIFCVLAVMIAGAILMFTVGVHNSYDFFGGTRICILTSGSQQEILNQLYATNID